MKVFVIFGFFVSCVWFANAATLKDKADLLGKQLICEFNHKIKIAVHPRIM